MLLFVKNCFETIIILNMGVLLGRPKRHDPFHHTYTIMNDHKNDISKFIGGNITEQLKIYEMCNLAATVSEFRLYNLPEQMVLKQFESIESISGALRDINILYENLDNNGSVKLIKSSDGARFKYVTLNQLDRHRQFVFIEFIVDVDKFIQHSDFVHNYVLSKWPDNNVQKIANLMRDYFVNPRPDIKLELKSLLNM